MNKTTKSGQVLGWLLILLAAIPGTATGSGWDFSRSSIAVDQIMSGGPPKDAVPALTEPRFTGAAEADKMAPGEQVLGVFLNGIARAYPTRILSWHELVNDRFGELPVLVSW